jgi:hypothetical protein
MKKRGKLDKSALAKFGLATGGASPEPIKEDPDNETVAGADEYPGGKQQQRRSNSMLGDS